MQKDNSAHIYENCEVIAKKRKWTYSLIFLYLAFGLLLIIAAIFNFTSKREETPVEVFLIILSIGMEYFVLVFRFYFSSKKL